ncbi:protein COP1 SUPPRESSOR 2 [Argentina anserina]|uniref:protein COP1 SUPPRESSOR 2 n=1 Tax=Argentina anserina TaxID=57926 RepID=UPI002176326B|nr:protein COP1 SUPPRESSOR 2 [Potentilla anserina]XP_050373550.1 protein COP1 SUPPRESSOR 2 [Potentilla anserina]
MGKNFRKRSAPADDNDDDPEKLSDDEQERRLLLEEVKFLQKQRRRRSGIPALTTGFDSPNDPASKDKNIDSKTKRASGGHSPGGHHGEGGGGGGDGENDDWALNRTFAEETEVADEDPNMLSYIEDQLAKKKGKKVEAAPEEVENELQRAEDELYKIPDHLKVKKRNSEESSTQWTTGIAEVQLPIEYKLRNIEETEAAKKFLHEKRLVGQTKSEISMPSSYSADYFQRGRDYAEKLRREHLELYKDKSSQDNGGAPKQNDTGTDAAGQRQAATDEFMLERFRKRERHRGMRR